MSLRIATTAFEIADEGNIQLTPSGYFRAIDGRPTEKSLIEGWYVNENIANNIINKLTKRQNPIVVDYNHSSLIEGHEAPAAGWIKKLFWQEGLRAKVEWTERASRSIKEKEHRFISPVFVYESETGHLKELINAALTNTPALDGMDEVALSRLAQKRFGEAMNNDNDILYQLAMKSDTLFNLLGIEHKATEAQVVEAIKSLLNKIRAAEEAAMAAKQQLLNVSKEFGLDNETVSTSTELLSAITQLKSKVEQGQVPAELLAQYTGQIEALRRENAELFASLAQGQKDSIIQKAQQTGQLPLDEEDLALKYAKNLDEKALLAYLETRPMNRPPIYSQTGGKAPFETDTAATMRLPMGYEIEPASELLHQKIRKYMTNNPDLDYATAARAIGE